MDKEKKPRKPRAKKEMKIPAIMSAAAITSPVERAAIKALQKKEVDKAENKSASTLQRAIRSNLARKTVKTARATKAMDDAEDFLSASKINRAIKSKIARSTMTKMRAEGDAITVPVPKTKRAKKEKVVYKMSYSQAVKKWNQSKGNAMWCSPKKNSDEYKAVQQLRL